MANALEISYPQADRLFADWPTSDTSAWLEPRTQAAAKDAAKRIELFIKSGGEV